MRLESARAFREEVREELRAVDEVAFLHAYGVEAADQLEDEVRLAFVAGLAPRVGVGIAKGTGAGDFQVAVRTSDPEVGRALKERAAGEADVRVLSVTERTIPSYLQARQRPLEPGLSVGLAQESSAGTLGALVRDRAGALYGLSNSHVLAARGLAPLEAPILQPGSIDGGRVAGNVIGTLARFVPFRSEGNLVDCALVRLRTTQAVLGFTGALQDVLAGAAAVSPDDLGEEVVKLGRTTGRRVGTVTAVEIDGLPVGMGTSVVRFSDQVEASGGVATDFSAAGDSGSLIVRARDRMAIALLFAGGRDQSGEDFTYGNRITNVLSALEVELALE